MLLTIDAGNTNVVFALYDGAQQVQMWRCKTDSGRTADEYTAWLYQLFSQNGLDFNLVSETIICSVVPDANVHLVQLCEKTFGAAPLMVSHETVQMTVNLDKPAEIGADRLVNAVAVLACYQAPAVVIDFGTATTFDVINGRGEYCGGVIAPGVNLSMQALHQAAAKLPKIGIQKTDKVIGTDTVSAMQSGVYWGYVAMIEGTLARIEAEMGEKPLVIATGGLADLFADTVPAIEKVDKNLTLRGLLSIHKQANRGQKAA
ncbi:MAG: type III pantothenate kinase [Rhodospirillales bacterium]|nr:type III pantothenate kinase [Rhodospirillales bacterium]MCB9995601.1 type III pantothenate kinase [Rhodospirillales bacterium]